MGKYKFTIIFALVFTIPLLGYFVVNGYWWLFDGNHLIEDKMAAAAFCGVVAAGINTSIGVVEGEL